MKDKESTHVSFTWNGLEMMNKYSTCYQEFASQGPLYCTPNLQKSLARFQLKLQQQFSGNSAPFLLTMEVNLQEKGNVNPLLNYHLLH